MTELAASAPSMETIEAILREDLASGDVMLGAIAPVLRHLLANDGVSVFSDEIVARVRGMAGDAARQLLDAIAEAQGNGEDHDHPAEVQTALSDMLIDQSAFLGHLHALSLEWMLTEQLLARLALDPVLSPLLQALIASPEPAVAEHAMHLLAAQARFCQTQRRMQLPLAELPGDLLHTALLGMRAYANDCGIDDAVTARAEATVRADYDESRGRLGLIARLIVGMGGGAVAALSVTHAGVAVFVSALALATGQDRDTCIQSTNEAQLARLALSLRMAGLKPAAIAEQFMTLHPDIALPEGFDRLGSDRAAAILSLAGGIAGA